ncbi:tripartite tricarboxylate transporter substrate binding protein [Roseomonas eburnea]|uniref:Tripartite tricarboxylate transporter substrate binding protein n=2 Tax=Neoroseomonas eburnea TaxID=1346889 RepID=A0A9X9X8H7_9PROT|nr:tripartite tricarboxylate transporter substrate binding protein [Neoroseomonas eburnea]
MNRIWRAALAALSLVAGAGAAMAQDFPVRGRPLMFMTAFPAGTAMDIYGRLIQERVQQELGVPMVIDIRSGASGNIGMEAAARAAPDGHSVLIATSAMLAINPAVLPAMPVNTQADFIPLMTLFEAPNFMTVSTEKRPNFTTCGAVVEAARAAPGRLNYASTGIGASTHLAGAQFAAVQGIDLLHVPYRGGPFAMTALLQGDVDVFFYQTGPVIEMYRQGRVRLLGVTSSSRIPAVPEVPTIAEACNMPGFESTTWYGLVVPARTPAPIVARLADVFGRIAREPAIEAKVIEWGFAPSVADGETMRRRLAEDLPRWRAVVERVGARVN